MDMYFDTLLSQKLNVMIALYSWPIDPFVISKIPSLFKALVHASSVTLIPGQSLLSYD